MTTTPPPRMIEKMARAICCPDGVCRIEELARREVPKYMTKVPCHALGLTNEASAALALVKREISAALEGK